MKKILFIPLMFLGLFSLHTYAQVSSPVIPDTANYPYWISMMQDPSVNFYAVQRAFNLYWKDRKVTRSSGWKPFKRWEYMMRCRIYPDGTRPAPDKIWNEYFSYLKTHNQVRSPEGDWDNLGPFTIPNAKGYQGLGRINAIAFHSVDPNTIYIGAPSGGMWTTHDYGQTWTSNTDVLPTLGVSAIAINYDQPDIMYIGTGDRDAGDAPGLGVMKSNDGGQTWVMCNTGMGNVVVGRIIVHPENPDVLLAATSGGIFKTVNGGDLWYKTLSGDKKDIVFKTDDPSVIFATGNGAFYRSDDTGETWQQITAGLPGGERAVIAVTPANPNVVYFLQTAGSVYTGTYRSTDGGFTFEERSTSPNIMSWGCDGGDGGQAWYDLDLTADPLNANTIFTGGVNCFKSTDGGITWFIVSHWWGDCSVPAVHADLHDLEWDPHDGRLFASNDGGIYYSPNGGTSWYEITNGIAISQTYKLGQSATVRDLVINGYQDNGTSTFDNGTWTNVIGGDGMECAVDQFDYHYTYGTLYFGSIFRMYNNGNTVQIAGNGVGGINEDGAWVTPFILDVDDPQIMYVGYINVWRCKNVKAPDISWTKITDGENNLCSVMEQSPADRNILYVAHENNQLKRCDNLYGLQPEWTDISSHLPSNGWLSDLEAHPTNPDIVYMTKNNKVYKSTDRGVSWTDISGSLPDIYISSIVYYTRGPEALYIGTDAGIYYKDASMDDWILYSNGFPVAGRVTELEIYYDSVDMNEDRIRAATYGRGLWESELYYNTPTADFTADKTVLPVGCPVNFTDLSRGIPHHWDWYFEGGNPSYSDDQNPSGIVYDTEGTYTVKLVVTNPLGSDSLVRTDYLTVSSTLLPEPGFTASQKVFCDDEGMVQFTDTSANCPTAYDWAFDPNTVTFHGGTGPNSANPLVKFHGYGSYTVTETVYNVNGSNTLTRANYIAIGGLPLPFQEDFETADLSSQSWTISNPDNKITWAVTTTGGTTPGDKSAYIDLFDYIVPPGQRDGLISPAFDLTGFDQVFLNFQHAYAQRYPQISDSLIVYISGDCGSTWTRIFQGGENGTGNFATAPLMTTKFIPQTADDWCGAGWGSPCNTLDISQWAGIRGVKIKFESYSYLGNNIYIDNVNVTSPVGINPVSANKEGILIFPNPSKGTVELYFKEVEGPVTLRVYDLTGRVMFGKEILARKGLDLNIDLSNLEKGLYFIEVKGQAMRTISKLIRE